MVLERTLFVTAGALTAGLLACAHPADRASSEPGLSDALRRVTRALATDRSVRVAVLPFSERGTGPTQLGEYVSDKVVVQLANTAGVQLVERTRLLDATWDELCRSARGEISDATAKTIGERLGADAVIVGVLTDLGGRWELTARALYTETARVLAAAEASLPPEELPAALSKAPPRGRQEGCGDLGGGGGDAVAETPEGPAGGGARLELAAGDSRRLFEGASNRNQVQDPRFTMDVRSSEYVRNPWVMAEAELTGVGLAPGTRIALAGREDGRGPVKINKLLLVEVTPAGGGEVRRVFVGSLPRGVDLSVEGGDPRRLGRTRDGFTFGPGELDLTHLVPDGGPFDLRVWALSYYVGGWVSDVFLIAR